MTVTVTVDVAAHAEPGIHALFAHAAVLAVLKRDEDYAAECAQWSERGYRPHYCKHGTDQWVDWDNICAGCEDSLTVGEEAGQIAADAYLEWELAGEHIRQAQRLVHQRLMPKKVLDALMVWSGEAFMAGMSAGGRI